MIDSQFGVVLGTPTTLDLIVSNDNPSSAGPSVETGSKVMGFYLNVEASMTSGTALANLYIILFKNPGGNLTVPTPNAVGGNDNKKYVFHQEMRMMQKFDADVASNPRSIFNGVIVVPKLYQRNGTNDKIQLSTLSPGGNADVCVQCVYKEFR